jgi:hypothetical protein
VWRQQTVSDVRIFVALGEVQSWPLCKLTIYLKVVNSLYVKSNYEFDPAQFAIRVLLLDPTSPCSQLAKATDRFVLDRLQSASGQRRRCRWFRGLCLLQRREWHSSTLSGRPSPSACDDGLRRTTAVCALGSAAGSSSNVFVKRLFEPTGLMRPVGQHCHWDRTDLRLLPK